MTERDIPKDYNHKNEAQWQKNGMMKKYINS